LLENGTSGYWEITRMSEAIPPLTVYRAEDDMFIKRTSPLSLIFVEAKAGGKAYYRYADLSKSGNAEAIWRGNALARDTPSAFQRHDTFELVYVIRGKYEILIEDGRFCFEQGEAFLLNRYTRSALLFQENVEIITICMSKEYIGGYLGDEGIVFQQKRINWFFNTNITDEFYDNRDYIEFRHLIKYKNDSTVCKLISHLYDELKGQLPGYAYMVRGLVLRLLLYLDNPRHYNAAYKSLGPSTDKDLVEDMKSYMDKNPRRISRGEFSEMFHYSGGYLASIFKNTLVKPF